MIIGKVDGKPLHSFCIRGNKVFVVKTDGPGWICGYDTKTGALAVLAPAGMSYHQAATEAVSKLEAGKFHGREH